MLRIEIWINLLEGRNANGEIDLWAHIRDGHGAGLARPEPGPFYFLWIRTLRVQNFQTQTGLGSLMGP